MATLDTRLRDSIKAKIQAIANFPATGLHANIIDDRVIFAIAQAILEELVNHMDVLPAAHTGESLSSPTGQTVVIPTTATAGSTSHGATDQDKELVGMGSVA